MEHRAGATSNTETPVILLNGIYPLKNILRISGIGKQMHANFILNIGRRIIVKFAKFVYWAGLARRPISKTVFYPLKIILRILRIGMKIP